MIYSITGASFPGQSKSTPLLQGPLLLLTMVVGGCAVTAEPIAACLQPVHTHQASIPNTHFHQQEEE